MVRLMLVLGLVLSLAACGGSSRTDGLSKAEEEALQDLVDAAEAETAKAVAARIQAEADKAKAEADKATAEADKATAEAVVQAQILLAEAARLAAEAALQDAVTAGQEAETAGQEAETARGETAAAVLEQQRLQAEAAAARQQVLQTEAKAAFKGLEIRSAELNAPEVTAKYNAPALVDTFTSPRRSPAPSGWYATRADSLGQDNILVYSDVRGPKSVRITQHPVYKDQFTAYQDTTFLQYNNFTTPADYSKLIASSRFPIDGLTDTPEQKAIMDADDRITGYELKTPIRGTFAGADGTFYCTSSGDKGCEVDHSGENYVFTQGTWSFRAQKTATVKEPDENFMYFGWWRRQIGGVFFYGTFGKPNRDESTVSTLFNPIEGDYIYNGPAIGQYAIYQPLGTQSNHGEFKATARFTAKFGTTSEPGTISGTVSGFDVAPGWELTLGQTEMTGSGLVQSPDDAVSWTIDGTTYDGGEWNHLFQSEITPYEGQVPEGLTGTFNAVFGPPDTDPVGRLQGAYGAHKGAQIK